IFLPFRRKPESGVLSFSRSHFRSSFRRRHVLSLSKGWNPTPCSGSSSFAVTPAQAGIQLDHVSSWHRISEQSFRSSCGGAGYFLLFGQEKVTKEKATPGGAPSGHPALRVRERAAGFAECTSVYMQRTGAHSCAPPCGLVLHPLAAPHGAPG